MWVGFRIADRFDGEMFNSAALYICLCVFTRTIEAASDSVPEAITVYRNPEFFKNIHYESDQSIYEFSDDPYNLEGKKSFKKNKKKFWIWTKNGFFENYF